jgi:hypothetical protein
MIRTLGVIEVRGMWAIVQRIVDQFRKSKSISSKVNHVVTIEAILSFKGLLEVHGEKLRKRFDGL